VFKPGRDARENRMSRMRWPMMFAIVVMAVISLMLISGP
jgi:hypothetical protein